MLRALIAFAVLLIVVPNQLFAQGKGIRLWNLTTATISGFHLSLAGKNDWGPNQCQNDNDGTVDHDERLSVTGLVPGLYDAKLTDKTGRTCIVKDVAVTQGVFAIEEKQLIDCEQK